MLQAASVNRTHNLLLTGQLLCQLSYDGRYQYYAEVCYISFRVRLIVLTIPFDCILPIHCYWQLDLS